MCDSPMQLERKNEWLVQFIKITLNNFESSLVYSRNFINPFEKNSLIHEQRFLQLKSIAGSFIPELNNFFTPKLSFAGALLGTNELQLSVPKNENEAINEMSEQESFKYIDLTNDSNYSDGQKNKYKWKSKCAQNFLSNENTEKWKNVCKLCNQNFQTISRLRSHMRKHTSDRPYQCDQCDYKCKNPSHLKVHLRIHNDLRPYQCSKCEYSCKTSSNLKKHERLHTGERPFKCMKCKKQFSDPTSLRWHLKVHTSHEMNLKNKQKTLQSNQEESQADQLN